MNRGVAAARNAGAKAGSGEYLAFLDADDTWLAGKLTRTVAALDANREAVLAFSDLIALEPSGETQTVTTGPAPSMDDLLKSQPRIQVGTWLMRRNAFEQCGGFCEEFRACGGEDLYMLLRARELGEFVYVATPLLFYRAPAWPAVAGKYSLARRPLIAILRSRYGERSRILRRDLKRLYASSHLQRALEQIDRREIRGAAISLIRSICCDPLFVFQCVGLERAFSSRNLARLRRLVPRARHDA
jgi:glycosyltransferase involved in cell wall biosynthesis